MKEGSEHAQPHIDWIAKQEMESIDQRTFSERVSDLVTGFAGSLMFVALHGLLVLFWISVNTFGSRAGLRFDPYPFSLLGLMVAIEAVVLSSFILIRQNRMAVRAGRRDHLHLQVDLIAEKEITKLLQMVGAVCVHMGLKHVTDDKELKEFAQATSVETLTQRIDNTLPEG